MLGRAGNTRPAESGADDEGFGGKPGSKENALYRLLLARPAAYQQVIEVLSEHLDVVVTPYTAGRGPADGKRVRGGKSTTSGYFLGSRPFASNSLFRGSQRLEQSNSRGRQPRWRGWRCGISWPTRRSPP